MSNDANTDDEFTALLEEAEGALENLDEYLGSAERLDELEEMEEATPEAVLDDVDTLASVAVEIQELVETIDLSELPEAVDGGELLAAIETGEIPDAITEDETGVGDVVDVAKLFKAIDLLEAWDATDLTDLWREKRELEAAVDDLANADDEDGDGGMIESAASTAADKATDMADDEEGFGDGDWMDDADPRDVLGDINVMEDPEAYQVAIQQAAMQGIDAFRAALLETHEKFERLVEYNRERMRRRDTSASSRNPTAASTMPTERAAVGSGVKHGTVPQDVRLSTAPSRKRIYGGRFERERERKREREAEDRNRNRNGNQNREREAEDRNRNRNGNPKRRRDDDD
ncbi:hypothetical protein CHINAEXTREME_10955 [Halobiforma lacisalsi AJ5]|uniref:Uncharacterized protein n=1 Tax=Natronobacterium lacisalsi AJ5 TaxID=358396 RepID=M0L5Z7_NATLA|nr:hypothetical protein [Halobiforma lacisalsi]APW98277.1 hypothetical protein CHINAEXTREME_10955 [Halobiforma lacisalsi AJ5]EMA27879.1 hypothetical protein C445_19542 [Halobiforma lacisalsi AJ5]